MIADLLPRYYEAFGNDVTYNTIHSFIIQGHEVAWMEMSGYNYTFRSLHCECYFTEEVGWRIDNGRINLEGEKICLYRQAIIHLRHLELRQEYQKRYQSDRIVSHLLGSLNLNTVILDLMQKVRDGEFIGEDGSGAAFYGGYFYLQTVMAISDMHPKQVWEAAKQLVEEGKISLEGSIIQDYREPPAPEWTEEFRIEEDGWVGIAHLPAHSKMTQVWKLDVMSADGLEASEPNYDLHLSHRPDFGPDVDDVTEAEIKLQQLISHVKIGNKAP